MLRGWSNTGAGSPEKLWSLLSWRSSKPVWTWYWTQLQLVELQARVRTGQSHRNTFLPQPPCNSVISPLVCLLWWSLWTPWRQQHCHRRHGHVACLQQHFDPCCLRVLLTTWPTRNCTPCVLWKARKAFKYLNGKLQGASCSQTILDTDSSLPKLSKTMSLHTLSVPWNRAGPAQLWFTLLWSKFQWDDRFPLQNTVVRQQLLHRAQDGVKNRWATLPPLYLGNQCSDAVTASCVPGATWIKMKPA